MVLTAAYKLLCWIRRGKYIILTLYISLQLDGITCFPFCCALRGTRWRFHSTTVDVNCVFSYSDTAGVGLDLAFIYS